MGKGVVLMSSDVCTGRAGIRRIAFGVGVLGWLAPDG